MDTHSTFDRRLAAALSPTICDIAWDTVNTFIANPGAGPTATVASPGDNLTVRNFNGGTDVATLEQMWRRGATAGFARVRSPRLHDNATGINFDGVENVTTLGMPNEAYQPLYPADNLIVEVSGGSAETDSAAMLIYYSNLPGINATYLSPGDVMGSIRNMKLFQVATVSSATPGTWVDTAITTTENQLHADADYAVLGYQTSTVLSCVGFKAPETGNLRTAGPGTTVSLDTTDWFIRLSRDGGNPAIPVFNANNRFGAFVSTVDTGASTAATVTLVCAELNKRVTGVA